MFYIIFVPVVCLLPPRVQPPGFLEKKQKKHPQYFTVHFSLRPLLYSFCAPLFPRSPDSSGALPPTLSGSEPLLHYRREFMCYLVHKVPGGNSGPESVTGSHRGPRVSAPQSTRPEREPRSHPDLLYVFPELLTKISTSTYDIYILY